MIITWLNVHLWGPMWPNMFAPSVITLAAVAFTHVRAYRQRERHHAEQQQAAGAVQRITADLFRHHAGRAHPDAPDPGSESEAK